MTIVRTDPALVQRILSDNAHQPLITPTQWLVHTAVDGPGPTNLGDYFENHTALESHEWLRWASYEQLIWYDRSADANYKVNHWWNPVTKRYEGAISTETEDDGDPIMRPWNDYQLKQLVRGGVWKHKNLGIPARLCRSVHDPGMGWHSMYPMEWTNVPGKTCPGSTRIEQFKTIVLPGIQRALAVPAHEEEEEMPTDYFWFKDNRDPAQDYRRYADVKEVPLAEGVHLYAVTGKQGVYMGDEAVALDIYLHGLAHEEMNVIGTKANPQLLIEPSGKANAWFIGFHLVDGPLAGIKK